MIGAGVQPLTLQVKLGGEPQVKSGLAAIGRGAKAAEKSVGAGATGLRRWLPSLGGIKSSIGSIVGSLGSIPGMLGIGLGAIGIGKLVGEVLDYDKALVSFKASLGATASEIEELDGRLTKLAETIGKNRGELLKAVRTGVDFGMTWSDAADAVEQAWALSEVWQTDLADTMKNIALIRRVSPETTTEGAVGWMQETQKTSGVTEQEFSQMVSRMMREGEEGIRAAGGQGLEMVAALIAGAGGTGFGRITTAGSAMGDLLKLVSGKGMYAAAAGKAAGWTTEDTAQTRLRKLIDAYHKTGGALVGVETGLLDLLGAMDPARVEAFNAALDRGASDYAHAAGEVARAGDELKDTASVTFAGLLEQIKTPLIDGIRGAVGWLVEHKDELRAAFQTLWEMLKLVTDGLGRLLSMLGFDESPEVAAIKEQIRTESEMAEQVKAGEGGAEAFEADLAHYLATIPMSQRMESAQRLTGGDEAAAAALVQRASHVNVNLVVESPFIVRVRAAAENASAATVEGANA